jgi:hypothetical protein
MTKDLILKIAKEKDLKSFYKKYPSEEAFMKQHGKAFKKAQTSSAIDKSQGGQTWGGSMFNQPGIPQEGYTPGTISLNDSQVENAGGMYDGYAFKGGPSTTTTTTKQPFDISGITGALSGIGEGAMEFGQQQALTENKAAWAGASNVLKDAEISTAYTPKQPRQHNRPDDRRAIVNTSELYTQPGRGSDILTGQNGSLIGGNPTEIQNTYAPKHTLFDDLGYEPLYDSNQVKAFQGGGGFGNWFGQATDTFGGDSSKGFMGNMGQKSMLSSFGPKPDAGSKIGSNIGSFFGPAGEFFGGAIGGALDTEDEKQKTQDAIINSNFQFGNRLAMAGDITGGLSNMGVGQNGVDLPTYEEGGYMNPEYNPQVIAMFGDHNAKDFADYAHKFRAGGHLKEYTPPSNRAMETFALGGKLQSHWGGGVEDISYNPYLPGSGRTAMISGATHPNGGVGISYGDEAQNGYGYAANGANMEADIEAETREPVIEMADGGNINPQTGQPETSAVVFGNIPFTKKIAEATGDEDLIKLATKNDGRTYKKIIADFAKGQNKAQSTITKASELANDADNTKWGKLTLNTAEMMKTGGNTTLKNFADSTMKLANLQDATQDVKKEKSYAAGYNLSAEELGKGNEVRDYDPITKDAELENPYAKSGALLSKAQNSKVIKGRGDKWDYSKVGNSEGNPNWATQELYDLNWTPVVDEAYDDKERAKKMLEYSKTVKGPTGDKIRKFLSKYNTEEEQIAALKEQSKNGQIGPVHYVSEAAIKYTAPGMTTPLKEEVKKEKEILKTTPLPYKGNKLADIYGMISPLFERDQLPGIDQRQFAKEYMSMAQNQYEPVQAQQYFPELDPVYRMSYEDAMNQNTADFRDVERQLGNNPAALSDLLANKYKANQSVKAEEFRTNQAIEQQIFGGNRGKINQAKAINLQLLADQRDKQQKAKSITKETQQEAVGSIADKYLQHDARNQEYRVRRNLFPKFGYDPSGKIHTQGPWYQPNIPQIYGSKATLSQVPIYGPDGKITGYQLQQYDPNATEADDSIADTTTPIGKSGKSISKNAKNSSVVKAYKNL